MYQRCNRCPFCLAEPDTWSPDDITSVPVSVLVDLHDMFVLKTANVHKSVLKFMGKFNETHPWSGVLFYDTFTFGLPTCSIFSYIFDYSLSINTYEVMQPCTDCKLMYQRKAKSIYSKVSQANHAKTSWLIRAAQSTIKPRKV